MRSINRRWKWAAVLAIAIFPGDRPGGRGGATARAAGTEEAGAGRLKQMKALAETFTVAGAEPSSRSPMGPAAEPSFRYDEPARGFLDGTIWTFGGPGRPRAALKVEFQPKGFVYGLVSLAPGTVAARGIHGWRWSSTRPGLAPAVIPSAPEPAKSGRERLLQVKALARRFSATEDDGPPHGILPLRLLPQPIHRYADPAAGTLDGVIFAFASGTNPDILLVIEAAQVREAPAPVWQYGFARIGGSQLSGKLDGRVVWNETFAFIPANQATYANFTGPLDDLKP